MKATLDQIRRGTLGLTASALASLAGAFAAQAPSATPVPDDQVKAFFRACEHGDMPAVTAMVAKGVDVNVHLEGYPVLVDAASRHQWAVVKFLLSKGADPNAGGPTEVRALSFVCRENQTDVALALLNAGENPNLCDQHYLLPIVYVARADNIELMKAFIAHHADVNLNGVDGPALYHAVGYDHLDMVQLLLDSGAKIDIAPRTERHPNDPALGLVASAANHDNLPMIDLLLAHGAPINAVSENGETALSEAFMYCKKETFLHLIEKGADPTTPDKRDLTPLMFAAGYGGYNPDVMQALLDRGAKIEQTNSAGQTPLIYAGMDLLADQIKFLCAHGANVNAVDKSGQGAVAYAGSRGATEIVDLLVSLGAKQHDVHVAAWPLPTPPLAPAQSFALAVGAIYPQVNGSNPHVLGWDRNEPPQFARTDLKDNWEVTDRASYLQELAQLHDHGHRDTYRSKGAQFAKMNTVEWAALMLSEPQLSAENTRLRDCYTKWGDRTGLAWDLCRYVNYVGDGRDAGYLTNDEAWDYTLSAAREIQARFKSWQEMADNFLDGRVIWNRGHDAKFENCLKLLLDPKEKESVWNQIPWNTDLGK